jgi:hypothetical protein
LYFGSTKINNNFTVSMRLPRKAGKEWRRPALEAIQAGKAYYGKAPILGTPYVTGYEPIKDASGAITAFELRQLTSGSNRDGLAATIS